MQQPRLGRSRSSIAFAHDVATLFGTLGEGGSFKMNGSPRNVEDEEAADTAQPPFLLRWSPAFFAEKLPDVFAWESRTNRLSLQPRHRHRPPWKAVGHHKQQSPADSWLYCDGCHASLFGRGASEQSHIPFRDQASLDALRGDVSKEAAAAPEFSAPRELKRRWQAALARAARQNRPARKKLDHDNLVPVPQPQYWQDAPVSSTKALQTE